LAKQRPIKKIDVRLKKSSSLQFSLRNLKHTWVKFQ